MRRFGVALVALVVVACGGGGTTPDDSTSPTNAPTRPSNNAVVLPNSTWHIASIDGQPSTADPPTKVFIGLPNAFNGLQVSGLCKTLFGTYKLDGAALTPALELGEATECTGDAVAYRQSIMEAINGATGWSMAGDTVTLTGARTIVLQRG
jgi:heat shock protein HslJ